MKPNMIKSRTTEGIKVGIVGFLCNVSLFIMKFMVGSISNSYAIVADAINNLSDSMSSLITIVGFKLSSKPADKEHPYGHERFEAISGFIISVIMLYLGVDIIKSSIQNILNPEPLETSRTMLIIIVISIVIKLMMTFYYRFKGKKLDSEVLFANAQDSMNDVLVTCSIGIAIIIQKFTGFRMDGWIAIALSLFIIYSAIMMLKRFMDDLLGTRPNSTTLREIESILETCDPILGYHDLMIHAYGKYHVYGVVHVEVDSKMSLLEAHDIVDELERSVLSKTGINFVVHLDPLDTENPEIIRIQKIIKKFLTMNYPGTSFHDLRFIHGKLYFEVVLTDLYYDQEEIILKLLTNHLKREGIQEKFEIGIEKDQLI